MTFDEYNNRVNGVIRDLQSGVHSQVMVRMATTALTLIKSRVQETGTDAKGSKYRPYSTKAMLTSCKSFQKKNCPYPSDKDLKWVTLKKDGKNIRLFVLPGGYKQFRDIYGAQTNHVDFSLTNDMWNDINVISTTSDHQKGVAIIGAKQDIEKKKLAGNTKRRGDILDLSQKEIDQLKEQYNLDVLNIFRNNGL